MSEIRIIERKKNGDCMYGHFGQASLYTFTLYRKLCYFFPETRNPMGRVELSHVFAWGSGCRREFKTLTFRYCSSKGGSERSRWNDSLQTG